MGAVLQADVRTPTILAILLACRVPMRLTAAPAVLKMAALLDIFLKNNFQSFRLGVERASPKWRGTGTYSFSQRDWGSD
jgi:hypothetical protein